MTIFSENRYLSITIPHQYMTSWVWITYKNKGLRIRVNLGQSSEFELRIHTKKAENTNFLGYCFFVAIIA